MLVYDGQCICTVTISSELVTDVLDKFPPILEEPLEVPFECAEEFDPFFLEALDREQRNLSNLMSAPGIFGMFRQGNATHRRKNRLPRPIADNFGSPSFSWQQQCKHSAERISWPTLLTCCSPWPAPELCA